MVSMPSRLLTELVTNPGHLKRLRKDTISKKQFLKVVAVFTFTNNEFSFSNSIVLVSSYHACLKNIVC